MLRGERERERERFRLRLAACSYKIIQIFHCIELGLDNVLYHEVVQPSFMYARFCKSKTHYHAPICRGSIDSFIDSALSVHPACAKFTQTDVYYVVNCPMGVRRAANY